MSDTKRIKGTLVGVKKAISMSFYIDGEDGVRYFSHKQELRDTKQYKHYVYNGNTCEFSFIDEGKEHQKAIDVVMEEIKDPLAFQKRERAAQQKQRELENKIRKANNIIIANKKKEIADQKREFYKNHTQYILEKYDETNGWMKTDPCIINPDLAIIREIRKANKTLNSGRYRIRKCRVIYMKEGSELKTQIEYL